MEIYLIFCLVSSAVAGYHKQAGVDCLNEMLQESLVTGYLNVTKESVIDFYKVERLLSKKSLGPLFAARTRKGNWPVVLKYISKAEVDEFQLIDGPRQGQDIATEIYYHRLLDHPNIIKLLDYHQTRNHYILVLERPERCLDLLRYMRSREYGGQNGLDEGEAARVFKQIIAGVVYTENEWGIFHRDIKSENVVLDIENGVVKLIDFGLAELASDGPFTEFVGTTTHCPPEFFSEGFYDSAEATVWQLGCTLYDLLSGDLPTLSSKQAQLDSGELPSNMSFDFTIPSYLSPGAINLLEQMLTIDPDERTTLEDILHHPWLQQRQQ